MKLFVVLSVVALSGATEIAVASSDGNVQLGKVVSNELLRTNRRIFSGGWGSGGGGGGGNGGGDAGGYRPGPPPGLDGSLMSLFNAMSSFGFNPNSNYGPPASGGGSGSKPPSSQYGPPGSGGGGSGPSSQYGPPGSGGGGSGPSSQYGPPSSGGSGGRPPSSQYGPPQNGGGSGGPSGGYSGGQAWKSSLGGSGLRNLGLSLGKPLSTQGNRPGGLGGAINAGLRNSQGNAQGAGGGAGAGPVGPDGGRIFRYVSLFTAPEEPAPTRPKIVRAGPTTPDKHVNIIFVKPPTPPAEQPTEVVLAPEPQRKTIVYVLMRKPSENQDNVRVRPAPPTQPPKPEVFFIPYSDPNAQGAGGPPGQGGPSGGNDNAIGNGNNDIPDQRRPEFPGGLSGGGGYSGGPSDRDIDGAIEIDGFNRFD